MKKLAMAGAMVVAGAAALPGAARADVHVSGHVVITVGDERGRGDWRGGGPAFRYGYDRGWRDGSDEGYRDGRRNRDARYWREDAYRDGDRGYKGWMGPRFEYVRGFREGYEAGYRRAYAASRPDWRERDRDRWWRERHDSRDDGRHRPDDRDWR
jgi:hypothetical protein